MTAILTLAAIIVAIGALGAYLGTLLRRAFTGPKSRFIS